MWFRGIRSCRHGVTSESVWPTSAGLPRGTPGRLRGPGRSASPVAPGAAARGPARPPGCWPRSARYPCTRCSRRPPGFRRFRTRTLLTATGLAAGLTAVDAIAGPPDGSWHTPPGTVVPDRYWASKATAARTGLARLVALAEPLRRTARPDRDHWHYAPIRAAVRVERWSSSPGFAREPRRSGACREQTRNRTRGGEGEQRPVPGLSPGVRALRGVLPPRLRSRRER